MMKQQMNIDHMEDLMDDASGGEEEAREERANFFA